MRAMALFGLVGLASACAAPGVAPGSGWSRASDLSAYSAMATLATVAREETAFCYGYSPATVFADWDRDFAGREQAVVAALVERHGEPAVRQAQAEAVPTRRVGCPEVQNDRWRYQYVRLLRLLEMRLGLA